MDAEVKEKLEKDAKEIEDNMKATLALVPPDQRSALEAQAKQMITMLRSPEAVQVQRAELEEARRGSKENFESQLERWRTNYPADPQLLIARRLREFLATSAGSRFCAVGDLHAAHGAGGDPERERGQEHQSQDRTGT
jgi:hypothetical protein